MTTNVRFCLSHGPSDEKKKCTNSIKIAAFHSQVKQLTTKDSVVQPYKNSSFII